MEAIQTDTDTDTKPPLVPVDISPDRVMYVETLLKEGTCLHLPYGKVCVRSQRNLPVDVEFSDVGYINYEITGVEPFGINVEAEVMDFPQEVGVVGVRSSANIEDTLQDELDEVSFSICHLDGRQLDVVITAALTAGIRDQEIGMVMTVKEVAD